MEIEIISASIILLILVLLATIDMAFSQLSDVSLRRIAAEFEENDRPSGFFREILENRPRFRFALSSAIQFLLIVFTVLVSVIILNYTTDYKEIFIYSLIIALGFSIVFRQIIPRLLIWRNAEGKLMFLLPVVRPIYAFASFLANPFVTRLKEKERQNIESTVTPDVAEKDDEDGGEDFQALMEVGEAEGIIEESERELIETVVEFSETRAGEIMTPRTEIVALPIDSTVEKARDLIIEEKYSRLPVYRDKIENIEGVIYVRDLLAAWAEGKEDRKIETIMRPAFFVPETKPASELLKSMQVSHSQIAVVIDEYGGVAGLVTVEDILEELVGEIEDEDTEQEEIIEIIEGEDGYFDVIGSTEIGKIERLFETEIEDDDFTTIAGLVISELGYVPKRNENLIFRGLKIEILDADQKRINLLRLRRASAEEIEEYELPENE